MRAVAKRYRFLKTVETDLKHLESILTHELQAYEPVLAEAAVHLMNAGGKRLRPVMALLAGRATADSSPPMSQHHLLAMSIELLHTATLIHDDIIDHAMLRRGLPTVNQQWGERVSVLTGDFLLARACYSISLIEQIRLNQLFSKMVMDMCNGEIAQLTNRFKPDITEDMYFFQIECKTALLMAVGCQGAGIINQVSPEVEQALYTYGRCVGMAFQIIDDILDFTVSSTTLGKPNLNDLREGYLTLPVIYALQQPAQAKPLQEIIQRQCQLTTDLATAAQLVEASGGLAYAHRQAEYFVKQAQAALTAVTTSVFRDGLLDLSQFILQRDC